MSEQAMCYVAEDPQHPGEAWAAMVDLPGLEKDIARELAKWVREGAKIQRVTDERAREMLSAWSRRRKEESPDLFG